MIIAGTGHRPPTLGLDYSPNSQNRLRQFVKGELEEFGRKNIVDTVYCGMAQGFDQALAAACVALKIPFIAAIPFTGQESKWPGESQRRYNFLLNNALRADNVSGLTSKEYKASLFADRDRYMVDNADGVLALYNGFAKSGTGITVSYALTEGKPVYNLWENWQKYVAL